MDAPYVRHLGPDGIRGVEVVSVRLDVDAAALARLSEVLCETERQRANRFVFQRHRSRFVVARAHLRHLLAARLDAKPESVRLAYGARGKPALAPPFSSSDLRFNLSHSDDVAVYAFATGIDVGIDVERIRPVRDAERIAARFFSPSENEALLALDPRDRPTGFFNCWTRKEAFIKALGEGLYYPLDRFDVSLDPERPATILRIETTQGDGCPWCLRSFSPAPGFVAAVVAESDGDRDATDIQSGQARGSSRRAGPNRSPARGPGVGAGTPKTC